MTDKLIMTTAERDSIENLLAEVGFDKRPLVKVSNMLQSLPVVSNTPMAYLAYFFIEPTPMTTATNDAGYEVVEPTVENAFPVYTSPQALTQISADDVTDKMDLDFIWSCPGDKRKRKAVIADAYNAVATHLVKHRSEAR